MQAYLAGSIHTVRPDFYPLDPIFQEIFEKSNPIVFETGSNSGRDALRSAMMSKGMYLNDNKLSDHIPKSLYKKTQKQFKKFALPFQRKIKPWLAAVLISVSKSVEAGATEDGLDIFFLKKARTAEKNVVDLETYEQQLDFFSNMDEEFQIQFLKKVISENDFSESDIEQETQYWKNGNVKAARESQAELSEEFKQIFLKNRNKDWRRQLIELFKKQEIPFIIVGLRHLIGDNNLIDMLREKGFTVEQM